MSGLNERQDDAFDVPLVRSDAWLIAALTQGHRRPKTLWQLLRDADWLNRSIPTFDELSFGLPRLMAEGYATVTGQGSAVRIAATPKAKHIRELVDKDAHTLSDVLAGFGGHVGTRPYPLSENEDRALGRFPGLSPADLDTARAEYEARFWPWGNAATSAAQIARRIIRRA